MQKLLFSILFLPLLLVAQNECAPCNVLANSNMEITTIESRWPKIKDKSIVKINTLTKIIYEKFGIHIICAINENVIIRINH